jgi:EAL domain-containing protein (putative c-di-GMP-specific phosphodiesterase class I)
VRATQAATQQATLDQLFGEAQLRIALHGIHDAAAPERLIGHEALMRGPRGTPYESPPLAFAMAATLNLLERLDCRCINMAAAIPTDGLLFINVHPRTIVAHEEFWASIGRFGTTTARRPEQVVFEVVEHTPAQESDLPRALRELRALGFKIAVDDLGEGAAGLRRLVEVAPDFAKIDRFFVDGIDRDHRRRAIVDAVVRIGAQLQTRIIAEGVEREEERKVLVDLGVELAQGWLFGRPEEVHE